MLTPHSRVLRSGGALVVVAIAVAGCGATGSTARPVAAPASPSASTPVTAVAPRPSPLTITYREPANVFEIVDNLSMWWGDKCDAEYRAYWQTRFGITPEDEQRFVTYKAIRKRYYAYPSERSATVELFAKSKPADRIAEAFYEATTLDDAFSAVAKLATREEVQSLESIFGAYRSQLAMLLAESRAFPEIARALQDKLDPTKATSFFDRLGRFYGVGDVPRFTVLYIWWPPVDNTTANNRGSVLLLKYHPEKHRKGAEQDVEIPVHELAHWISAHQPEEQKQALATAFLARCDVASKIAPVKILEEPLAVVHQKMFLSANDPQRFDLASSWCGGDRWIGPFAKRIYPLVKEAVESGGRLDIELMKTTGDACEQHLRAP